MKFTKRMMFLALVLAFAMAFTTLAGCAQQAAAPASGTDATQAGSADEPVTITWATLAGFYTDWVSTLAAEYSEATGVKVNIVEMDLPTMYEKEVLDIVGGTGAYDIITWNVSWKGEWANAGYMLPLDDYIAADNDEVDIEDFPASMLQVCAEWNNQIYGLPYYTFTPGLMYRADLFEDPTEMANFKDAYGYDLDIPTTYDQMSDIAQFFTRKAGDLLKGEPLAQDMYGIGLMAGRYTNIFDEINTIAWTYGGDVINDDGTTGVQSEAYTNAVNTYVNDLLPYAPAGSLSGSYDFVISQFNTGIIAMTGPMYLDQWANAVKVEQNIPGSEAQCAGLPGGGKNLGRCVHDRHRVLDKASAGDLGLPEVHHRQGSTARVCGRRRKHMPSEHPQRYRMGRGAPATRSATSRCLRMFSMTAQRIGILTISGSRKQPRSMKNLQDGCPQLQAAR